MVAGDGQWKENEQSSHPVCRVSDQDSKYIRHWCYGACFVPQRSGKGTDVHLIRQQERVKRLCCGLEIFVCSSKPWKSLPLRGDIATASRPSYLICLSAGGEISTCADLHSEERKEPDLNG